MTKTLNHIIFFPPPKSEYFFQQHRESEYFFRKKTCDLYLPLLTGQKRSFFASMLNILALS